MKPCSALRQCWCAGSTCHRCLQAKPMVYCCVGCGHRFCFGCAHRLDNRWACVECVTRWLNVMCALEMPLPVALWLNQVTLDEPA